MAADPVLQFIMAVTGRAGHDVGMTLTVGGTIITGDLTTTAEYGKWLEQFLHRDTSPNDDRQPRAPWAESEASSAVSGEDLARHAYIHLRNFRVIGPDGRGRAFPQDAIWRGKADQNEGFIFGRMGPTS